MKSYLYCDPRSLNDATNYYCGLIQKSLENQGLSYSIVHRVSQIRNPAVILTITEKYFVIAKFCFPQAKTIYWAQGVGAEEAKMDTGSIVSKIRYCFRRLAEPIATNHSDILYCVSERMVLYYKEKYGLKDHGHILVMPCYNCSNHCQFDVEQYQAPVFAYAGNMGIWQSVDFMLDVYAIIEANIPKAELKLFSANREEFDRMCKEKGIVNYSVSYVPIDVLPQELHKCKYGFIIRTSHIVNMVATPTKMNTYLAANLIPIYSDSIDAFKNINLGEFEIKAKCPLDAKKVAEQIIHFESVKHDYYKYEEIVNNAFLDYYNDEKYLNLSDALIGRLLASKKTRNCSSFR